MCIDLEYKSKYLLQNINASQLFWDKRLSTSE